MIFGELSHIGRVVLVQLNQIVVCRQWKGSGRIGTACPSFENNPIYMTFGRLEPAGNVARDVENGHGGMGIVQGLQIKGGMITFCGICHTGIRENISAHQVVAQRR